MDNPSVTISCNELLVFDEDASDFAAAHPEFVAVPTLQRVEGTHHPRMRPSAEQETAAARICWLKVIRRFTKAVPGKKNCLRVVDAATAQPAVVIRRAQLFPGAVGGNGTGEGGVDLCGDELDAADKAYLILFATKTAGDAIQVVSTTVPWLEIVSITFRLRQPT